MSDNIITALEIAEFAKADSLNFTSMSISGGILSRSKLNFSPISATETDKFATVLKQPETKRKQSIALKRLLPAKEKISINLGTLDNDLLVVHLPNLASNNISFFFEIVAPANSHKQLVFIEHTNLDLNENMLAIGEDKQNLRPALFCNFQVERDADLNVVTLHSQLLNSGENRILSTSDNICLYHSQVKANGNFTWTGMDFAHNLHEFGLVDLLEQHAGATVNAGSYILSGQEQDFLTKINCHQPYANALIFNRGIVDGNSTGHMAAICNISKGAVQSKVRQENRFITLNEKAKAFADPTLLIDEYDVTASHLATVGQLDAESMFYLCSRGLSRSQAVQLATIGFLAPVVDAVPQVGLRQILMSNLTATVNENRGDT